MAGPEGRDAESRVNEQPASLDAAPLPERLISDVETLKALSDPLRIQILEAMVRAPSEPWTVKQIAKALGVGPTKLYHHIKILEDRELVRPVHQKLVRGIVETTYQIAQLSLRLDRRLIAGNEDDVRSTRAEALTMVFDLARRDIESALSAGLVPLDPGADTSRPFLLNRTLLRVAPERAPDLRNRLMAVIAEFAEDDNSKAAVPLGLFIALHPMPSPPGSSNVGR